MCKIKKKLSYCYGARTSGGLVCEKVIFFLLVSYRPLAIILGSRFRAGAAPVK